MAMKRQVVPDSRSLRYKLSKLHSSNYQDDFLHFMSKTFHVSRWFGVAGQETRAWKVWGIFVMLSLIIIVGIAVWRVVKALAGWAADISGSRSVTSRFAGTVFYTTSVVGLMLSWRLHASWRVTAEYWASVEMSTHVPKDVTLKRRMITFTVLFILCSTMEHILIMISQTDFDGPPNLILESYILKSHGYLFQKNDYSSIWIGIPILFFCNIATILWNFSDLLIVLISMGLASRYHRLNQYVVAVCAAEKKENAKSFQNFQATRLRKWRTIRECFVKQAMLVRRLDKSIGGLILLSSSSSFYFLCLQLFLGIMQGLSGPVVDKLYYLTSLAWLCARATFVILSTAEVHVQSKRSLRYVHISNFRSFNVEMERLQNQLSKDYVTLTGMEFFTLNRSILLKMVGAIVTYELFLIQFDGKEFAEQLNMTPNNRTN